MIFLSHALSCNAGLDGLLVGFEHYHVLLKHQPDTVVPLLLIVSTGYIQYKAMLKLHVIDVPNSQ